MHTIALLLFLVPAPRPAEAPITLPGLWDLDWGTVKQIARFDADGFYTSPPYGDGTWTAEPVEGGNVQVTFREGQNWYVMQFGRDGKGIGYRILYCEDGTATYGGEVVVRMARREPMGPFEKVQ